MYKFLNQKASYQLLDIYQLSSSTNFFSKDQVFQLQEPQIVCIIDTSPKQLTNSQDYTKNSLNNTQNNSRRFITDTKSVNDPTIFQHLLTQKTKIRQKRKNRKSDYADNYLDHDKITPSREKSLFSTKEIKSPVYKKNNQKTVVKTSIKNTDYSYIPDNKTSNSSTKNITIHNPLSIHELATLISTPESEIIKWLFLKGVSVTINQVLDVQIATTVAENYGFIVSNNYITKKASYTTNKHQENELYMKPRIPIITLLGHINHGKTTLLKAFQKVEKIGDVTQTQLVTLHEVAISAKGNSLKVILLDTPGHEAFVSMRLRCAQITDLAILVTAADDIFGSQTIETIQYIKNMKIPAVVVINKIDQANADVNKIQKQLMLHNLAAKNSDSAIPIIPVSAKTGTNIDQLILSIISIINKQNLKANPNKKATGIVVDAFLDKNKGPLANVLVQNGTLSIGDFLVAGRNFAKVRAMLNYQHSRIQQAFPSTFVEIWGFPQTPEAGIPFITTNSEKEAKKRVLETKNTVESEPTNLLQKRLVSRITANTLKNSKQIRNTKQFNIILKTDTQGSVEAILNSLSKFAQEKVQLNVILAASGMITKTDVKLAAASNSTLIGFNTASSPEIRPHAESKKIIIRQYKLIHNLLNDIEQLMIGLIEPEYVERYIGRAKVNSVFSLSKGIVAGCVVTSGKITYESKIQVVRNKTVIHEGKLNSLKHMKEDIKEAIEGDEFGIMACSFQEWKVDDYIKFYSLQQKAKSL